MRVNPTRKTQSNPTRWVTQIIRGLPKRKPNPLRVARGEPNPIRMRVGAGSDWKAAGAGPSSGPTAAGTEKGEPGNSVEAERRLPKETGVAERGGPGERVSTRLVVEAGGPSGGVVFCFAINLDPEERGSFK